MSWAVLVCVWWGRWAEGWTGTPLLAGMIVEVQPVSDRHTGQFLSWAGLCLCRAKR